MQSNAQMAMGISMALFQIVSCMFERTAWRNSNWSFLKNVQLEWYSLQLLCLRGRDFSRRENGFEWLLILRLRGVFEGETINLFLDWNLDCSTSSKEFSRFVVPSQEISPFAEHSLFYFGDFILQRSLLPVNEGGRA
jgi:hypothetical protein